MRAMHARPYVPPLPDRVIKNRLGAAANGRERSDLGTAGNSRLLGVGRRAIELIQIYIVENSIWPSRSSNGFRFTHHQSNLFVAAHQDVKPGLTYCNTNPICSSSSTHANRSGTKSG